jgi:hypothetical protein
MAAISSILIRRARRDDVDAIVRMLADDPLGSARERLEDPPPPCYFRAFEALEQASNIQLVVAEDEDGVVIGCLQLCILPAQYPRRCAAILRAAGICTEPCRDDVTVLTSVARPRLPRCLRSL